MGDEEIERIKEEILRLKSEKGMAVFAHNYQIPPIQDVADVVGDSLYLAYKGQEVEQETIVMCGVDFMAESVKLLNPDKRVVHPNTRSRCPMAAMVDVPSLKKFKEEHPKALVVAYVNTTAAVKAETDVCVTSANAVDIVKHLDAEEIIFIPDSNLGLYVMRHVKDKKIHLWPGYCHVHQDITPEIIRKMKEKHPEAVVMVHPECTPEVIDLADVVASTEGMVKYARASPKREFIVGTEREHAYRLKTEMPDKVFYSIPTAICPNMKKITLQDLLTAVKTLSPEVVLPEDVMVRAKKPLERMIEISKKLKKI